MPRKLLLADDSVTVQRVIELTFADEDVDVTAVGDGDAAIRRLQSDPPDIVLADIGMPGRDGYQVAQHVHDTPALNGIPVLLLTGAFDPVDEARVRALGCAGVLVKPFEPQMVIARVRELLDQRAQRPQASAAAPPAAVAQTVATVEAAAPPDFATPTPATPAAAAQAEQRTSSSVDEYFARLDAAFATLNVPLDMPRSPHAPHAAPPAVPKAEPSLPVAAPVASAAPAESPTSQPMPPITLADAFGVLLGVEQGEPVPAFAESWQPAMTDDLVDTVARRVSERVTEQVIRQLAPDIVSRIAERVVREEIDRLKRLQG